jgi:hypothetical protein
LFTIKQALLPVITLNLKINSWMKIHVLTGSILFLCFLGLIDNAFAQKWLPGHYTGIKGDLQTGMIYMNPSGKSPVPGEAFIEFKVNDKSNPYKLSASDLKSFVIGRDSFVVAAEPQTGRWQHSVDFVRVVLEEDVNLYVFKGYVSGGNSGIEPDVEAGIGGGTGGYGAGVGIGLTIPIGRSGSNRTIYYYGLNTAQMHQLTNANFMDIMSNIMGDEPDVVEAIRENKYDLGNMNKLLNYFKQVQASHSNKPD